MKSIFLYIIIGISLLLLLLRVLILHRKYNRQIALIEEKDSIIDKLKSDTLSSRANTILSKILKVSEKHDNINDSCIRIVDVLLDSFDIDFCTIMIPNKRGKHLICASNIREIKDRKLLEEFSNEELTKEKANQGAIVYSSQNYPLQYIFSKDRNIRYYFLIPLTSNGVVIGSLVLEKYFTSNQEQFEEDFFNIVIDNITIVLENLLLRDEVLAMAKKEVAIAKKEADTDGLTGAYNRKYMNKLLVEEIENHRYRQESFSLAIFDIDHFKKFNDTYGHPFGDLVLKELVKFFSENIRQEDTLIRYGGEEFILFFPRTTNSVVYDRLEQLRIGLSKMSVSMEVDGIIQTVNVTSSFGLAEFPSNGMNINELVNNADKALYYSKENGRNRVSIYDNVYDFVNEE